MSEQAADDRQLAALTPSSRLLAQFQVLKTMTEKEKDSLNGLLNTHHASGKAERYRAYLVPLVGLAVSLEFTQLQLRQSDEEGRYLAVYEAVVYILAGGAGTPLGMDMHDVPRDLALQIAGKAGAEESKIALQTWIKGSGAYRPPELSGLAGDLQNSPDRLRQLLLTITYCCAVRSIKTANDAGTFGSVSLDEFVRSEVFTDAFSQNAIAQFFTAIALQGQAAGDNQTLRGFFLAESAATRFNQAPGAMNLAARFRIELSKSPDQNQIPVQNSGDVAAPREALLSGAVELASRAIQLDPDYPDYFWTRARAHSELGNWSAARPDFLMALYQAEAVNDLPRRNAIKGSWESYTQRMPLVESIRQVQIIQNQASADRAQLELAVAKVDKLEALREELTAAATDAKQMSETLRHEVNAQMRDQQREQFQVLAFLAAALALIVTGADAVQQATSDSYAPTLTILVVWLLCLLVLLGTGALLLRRRRSRPRDQ